MDERKRSPTSVAAAAVVTPERKRQRYSWIEGWCDLRSEKSSCSCRKADYASKCASCRSDIRRGHCIVKETYGWVHMRCENDHKRTKRELEYDFIPLRQNKLLACAPNQLLLRRDADIESDEQHQAAPVVSQEAQDVDKSSSFQQDEGNDGYETRHGVEGEADQTRASNDEYSSAESRGLTEEQQAILNYESRQCETIRITALAGCGKTTSLAWLCHNLIKRLGQKADRSGQKTKILYVVFGAQARIDASERFRKEVEICTSHAFAKQRLLGKKTNFELVGKIPREDVVRALKLDRFVTELFPQNDKKETVRISKAIASIVIKTLTRFQWSTSEVVLESHVPSHAQDRPGTKKRSSWKNHVSTKKYVSWATEYFCSILEYCMKPSDETIAHDSYLKVFQLVLRFQRRLCLYQRPPFDRYLHELFRSINLDDLSFDVVLVDKAQDLSPCQADILWGRHTMASSARIYLVGDEHQRIYGFRGASKSFEKASVNKSFPLQGSFRFGPNIAKQANVVLSCCSPTGAKLQGLSADEGRVEYQNKIERGVVICRTRNGMYRYLDEHQPERWAFYKKEEKLIKTDKKLLQLEDFVKKFVPMKNDIGLYEQTPPQIDRPYKYRGTYFSALDDLIEFCEEEDDSAMSNNIFLIYDYHKEERGESISELAKKLKDSWVPDWRAEVKGEMGDADINQFDGVVFVTAHGSKGLQFDNVLIHNDFKYDTLLKNLHDTTFAESNCVREQAHFIYVAMTRAKKTLFLCEEAASFINCLQGRRSILMGSTDDLSGYRDDMENAWASFVADPSAAILHLNDIPWPIGDEENPFCFDSLMSLDDREASVKAALLRYHSDHFLSRHGGRIASEELTLEVKQRLQYFSGVAKEIWQRLPRPAGNQYESEK